MYDSSLKYKWDNKNVLDYAKEEGIQEGIEKGKLEEAMEIALTLKKMGFSVEDIANITRLSIEEIKKL